MSNTCRFQPVKCPDLLHFFVLYYCRWRDFRFWAVVWTKEGILWPKLRTDAAVFPERGFISTWLEPSPHLLLVFSLDLLSPMPIPMKTREKSIITLATDVNKSTRHNHIMRLYESRLKPLKQSILILTAASVRQPGLELDPWRKKRQQKPSTNRPDIRRHPTQSYEVAAQLKPDSGFFFFPPRV